MTKASEKTEVEIQILICQKAIDRWVDNMEQNPEETDYMEKLIKREEAILDKYKRKFPEYFV